MAKTTQAAALDAVKAASARLAAVEGQIVTLKSSTAEPVVTEHAMLRYLERVKGLDLASLREEMLSEAVSAQIKALRTCRVPLGKGAHLVVEENTVHTAEVAQASPKQMKRKAAVKTGPKPAERRALEQDEA